MVGGIVFLMLARMWSWGFELIMMCLCLASMLVLYTGCLGVFDYRRRVWVIPVLRFCLVA